MLEFINIEKSYGENIALKGISFGVNRGELFGLIGPDGAGKSTLFRILTTVLLPDSGSILFDGHDVVKDYKYVRKNVGYMPGRFSLYKDLSVKENLEFFATIFNTSIEANYDLIKDIYHQLEPFEDRKAGALSGGMKQKLALSCALIHKPKVLVLDEPTFGVDAVSRKEFWDMLKSLKEKGVTIIVSTPYMDEASLCDRVALIQKGKILEIDTPEGIINSFKKLLYKVHTTQIYKALNVLVEIPETKDAYSFGQEIHIYAENELDMKTIKRKLSEAGIEDAEVNKGKANIEDCFMDLMLSHNLLEYGANG
jgi:ABC-type multidrug transport system ATPase subunit